MKPSIYFVVLIDADPKRSVFGTKDDHILRKYRTSLDLMKKCIDGKGVICVHTSPQYRDRFFLPPYIEFWEIWVREGGELALHPENYASPTVEKLLNVKNYYQDIQYVETLIQDKATFMKERNLPFSAFRGGFFGLTNDIARVLRNVGIEIDISCAPEVVRQERAADWSNAPVSGYYMSSESYRQPAESPGKDNLFEIPLGWDGKGKDLSQNYLFHERSTHRKLCKVWDAVVERRNKTESPQFINFLCHTYSMGDEKLRNQCEKILMYMQNHDGIPVTATVAKKFYDGFS